MRVNWEAAHLNYFNEYGVLIGHEARDVRAWLEAHPEYSGALYANWNDGSEDFEVTDIFRPEEPDETADIVSEIANEINPITPKHAA